MKLFDTHCHLDYLSPEALAKTLSSDISMITVSVSGKNIFEVLNLQNQKNIFATLGIHPTHSNEWKEDVFTYMQQNINHAIAIGEIGLDYHYPDTNKKLQQLVFEKQLQLAADYNKPVIIHCRDASNDIISILNNFKLKKVLIHSFTPELKDFILANNYFAGINGIVTFRNALILQETVASLPLEIILLETDAPFLAPTPHRGKENQPLFVELVAKKIGELKNLDHLQICEKTWENTCSFFNFT